MGGGWANKYVQLALPALLLVLGLLGLLLVHVFQTRGKQFWAAFVNRLLPYFLWVGLVLHVVLTLSTYWDITVSAIANMQDQPFDLALVIVLGVSVAAMVIGNRLPKRPQGDAFGIRTRWTLQDGKIWRKTHSLAGPLFVFAGILGLVLCLFFRGWLLVALCLLLLLIPMVTAFFYSWSLWRKKFQ